MDLIKSILNPGHHKDDETLYADKADSHSASNQPENQSLSSHAGPTSTLENATAGTLPTSADPDTQYSRDATTAEGAAATGLGSEHYNSSGVPASNTEIYGSALTHSSQKNEPTSALGTGPLSSVTPATNSAYPDSISTAPSSTDPNAGLPSVTSGTSSAHPDSLSTAQSSINPIGSPEHDSHFGRDAAIAGGAGATGLGAYEASKHHGNISSIPAAQSTSNNEYGSAKILGTTTTGPTVRSEAGAPGSTGATSGQSVGTTPGQSIGSTSSTEHGSHYGRDAALAGGVGAAGLGAYEAKKHHDASSTSQPTQQSTSQQLGAGSATGTGSRDFLSGSGISSSTTSRPEASSTASNASIKSGVLGKVTTSELSKSSADFPAVPATGGKFAEGASSTSAYPTTGDRAFPLSGGETSGSEHPSSASHLGRDAGIVGGTGLAGAGAAEAWKRHENSGAPTSATDTARKVEAGRQAHGASPAVTDNDSREEPAEWKDHTHGGVGHEYKGDPCGPNEDNTSSGSGLPPQGPHQTQAANLLDPSVKHMPGSFPRSESDMAAPSDGGAQTRIDNDPVRRAENIVGSHGTSSNDRHLGRDAGIAGGIGAAGLGAYAASKKHDTTGSGFGTQSSSTSSPTAAGGPFNSSTTTAPNTGLVGSGLGTQSSSSTGPTTGDSPFSSSKISAPNSGLPATDAKIHGENDSHTGRNFALGGGAAAAGVGGYEAYKHHENQQPAIPSSAIAASSLPAHSSTSGTSGAPYSSTPAAPSTGDAASRLRDDHDSHTGRNAALGSGAAAVGLGGYEAYKHHDNKDVGSKTQPPTTASTSTSAGAPGLTGTAPGEAVGGSESRAYDDKSHHGRDTAAGLGEVSKHHDSEGPGQNLSSSNAGSSLKQRGATAASDSRQGGIGSEPSKFDETSHHGRDAAIVGGAGAVGLGGYEAYKHHDQKENISGITPAGTNVRNDGVPIPGQQSNLTHNQKQNVPTTSNANDDKHHFGRDAAVVGAAGTAGAGAHHEFSKHEAEKAAKEQRKAEEKLAKEREHEAAKRHKEHEKEVKHHEKDAAKHHKEVEKEKKPSLISRILHRKKDKHGNEVDSEEEDPKHGHGHGKEAALGAGTAGAAGVGIAEHDGHNKLHKDPPAGHPAHDANPRSSRTYFTTAAGPSLEERAQAEAGGSHMAGTSHIPTEGHSTAPGTHGISKGEGIINDPHTGLPVNVGKYGDGYGGTDGNQAIHGLNTHAGAAGDAKPTDWEAIKKANTPY
ncbi:hypothetical protein E2P81_ATG10939 [Venturia nashicola]|nr:hypothetical protein E2P81_ATG10939 [Venturia nashicola]